MQTSLKQTKKKPLLEHIALEAPRYVGSPLSLILHSFFFVGIFALQWFGFAFDQIMLILTTVVSLEAIYLSIFIQMTVNHHSNKLAQVSEDVEDISEDVEDISKDIDTIHENVKDISEDVEDISEDVEDLSEEKEKDSQKQTLDSTNNAQKIEHIKNTLETLLREIQNLKEQK